MKIIFMFSTMKMKCSSHFHLASIDVLFLYVVFASFKVPDQKMKSSFLMTVCVRATSWDSALTSSSITQ